MNFPPSLLQRLKNVHTYAVTPFRNDDILQIDVAALEKNIEFLISHGMKVIAVGGGTGEIETLNIDELELLAKTALGVSNGRALIIACLPGNFREAHDLIPRYEKLGIELLLGMPPLIRGKIPADLSGVVAYFREIAKATSLPLMPYNTQGWPAELFVDLAEIDSIIGIKDPCLVPQEFFKAIQKLGSRFVWVGNKKHDPGVAHLRYQMGMEGFTSGQSNFWPEPELELHAAALEQNWPKMIEIQKRIAPLERLRMAHDDAAMVKAAMDIVGLHGGPSRPPRLDVPESGRAAIRETLLQLGVV
ncbi:MAG: dihydrodipicolinate synthase family protein [Planctomycetota bacterium]|nr:dihydrodipicolinate synthase family protein [Planctomycetota bacterium]MDA1212630.1 dihydrodipicolinate synthase family protein [Planctomycetota bacterium]